MRVPRKIKKKIPKGHYCYTFTGERGITKDGVPTMKVKNCPFYTYKNINEVSVPFCNFLQQGGFPNSSDEDGDKLVEYYGSDDKAFEALPLSLLFDQVKECGENKGND